jgi:methylated-DNA-[protein]-cysteine S-methyltransferase
VVTDAAKDRLRVLEFHDQPQRLARALRLHHPDQAVETGAAPAAVRDGPWRPISPASWRR